jgi:hypothetical protein
MRQERRRRLQNTPDEDADDIVFLKKEALACSIA